MPILKLAESSFTAQEIHDPGVALVDPVVLERFTKYAQTLRAVAPKAKDFLYFSCVMMHSAEAALVNQKTGEPLVGKDGKPITANWDINPKTGSWKWVCSDNSIRPYKNNNGDIFPESELRKAYRKWVEKPLCQDHKSNTVDGMRGLIIDTYWDNSRKRVIALCALDRKNYPDLARKIEGRYATNVSMGTEAEYCPCVRARRTYGEINIDLSPIELSLVVTGADPAAKLRHIIASLNTYAQQKQARIDELQRAGCVTPMELQSLRQEVDALRVQLLAVSGIRARAALDPSQGANIRALLEAISDPATSAAVKDLANKQLQELLGGGATPAELASMETKGPAAPAAPVAPAAAEDGNGVEGNGNEMAEEDPEGNNSAADAVPPYGLAGNKAMTGGRGSWTQDPESSGPPPWSLDGRETRLASGNLDAQILAVQARLDMMQGTLRTMAADIQATANRTHPKEEKNMSDLKERARARRAAFEKNAYFQGGGGVNDPAALPYPKEDEDKIRNTQDKQMVGEGMEPGADGLAGDDLATKKKLLRAELEERRLRRHALLSAAEETHKVKTPDGKDVTLVKGADGKWTVAPAQPAEDDEAGLETLAYFQGGGGVNEPQTYPVDPMNDKVKKTQDKQMVGEGMEPGNDGLAGDDLVLKKKLLRAEFKFPRTKAGSPDRAKAHWDVYAGSDLILTATGEQIYGEDLGRDDYWAHLSSEDYGRRIISEIRTSGLERTAYLLTGRVVTAQDPAAPMPPAPPAPPAGMPGMPGMAEPPAELPAEPKEEEKPGAESTKSRVDEALAEVEKAFGDLKEVLKEEDESAKPGKEELPPIEVGEAAKTASALDDSGDELAILSEVLGKRIEAGMVSGSEMDELLKIAEESLEASAELVREASIIVEAKKGKMPEGLRKALEEKGKKDKKEGEEEESEGKEKKEKGKKDEKEGKKEKSKKDEKEGEEEESKGKGKKEKGKKEEDEGKKSEAELVLEKMLKARAAKRRDLVRLAIEEEEHKLEEKEHEVQEEMEEGLEDLEGLVEELEDIDRKELSEADDMAQYLDEGGEDPLVAELLEELGREEGKEGFEEEPPADDMSAMAARRAWREKVAAEVGSKYQLKLEPATDMDTDMVPKAHPQRSTTLGGLDTKPSDEGARFEGIDEMKAMIMKQVETLPAVREAVGRVGDLLKSGQLAAADLGDEAKLRALAVDPEAAKYWKQYFGEGDPASKQFGQDLSKEFAQKKAAAEAESYRLKLRRAVDLALDMQDKGLISRGREAMNRQVDDIMKFDDQAFEAFKRALARTTNIARVAASSSPALQVGIREEAESATLSDQLGRLWMPKRK